MRAGDYRHRRLYRAAGVTGNPPGSLTLPVPRSAAGISQAVIEERVAGVRIWMAAAEIDALVVYGSPAAYGMRSVTSGYVRYLTGWMTASIPAMLVLPVSGAATILTTGPHDTRLFGICAGWFGDVVATGTVERYADAVALAIAGHVRVATLGTVELPGPLARALDGHLAGREVVAAEAVVDEMRLHRHPEEVALHRIGARISDAMIETAMSHAVLPEMTGPRLMADIENAGRQLGADTPATWLAIGERPVTTYMEAAELAGSIGPADRVQLGTSLSYRGHFAQGVRIGVRGTPTRGLRDYAQVLVEIQDETLAAMRPGVMLNEVSDVLESAIDRHCPYERENDPFRFQSCHGLGLSYVEPGMARDLDPRRDRSRDRAGVPLRENMLIEIHPNFTVPSLGHICAGDMALVTASGAEWITAFPRGIHRL
jgi:Xaa-Pro dipeptidase